jgi:endonuclease YncB( thermonuclease family)
VSRNRRKLDRAGKRFWVSTAVVLVVAPLVVLARSGLLRHWRGRGGHQARGRESRERVAKVHDGDTVRLASGERVRLLGIDAPEMREGKPGRRGPFPEPGAVQATESLRRMVGGKVVRILRQGCDRYGRTLARIRLDDGTDVGAELVRRGLARKYR